MWIEFDRAEAELLISIIDSHSRIPGESGNVSLLAWKVFDAIQADIWENDNA